MNNKSFNEAFRQTLRPPEPPETELEDDLAPPPRQPRRQSIDAGAGTSGSRMNVQPSMNDLIRRAANDRG